MLTCLHQNQLVPSRSPSAFVLALGVFGTVCVLGCSAGDAPGSAGDAADDAAADANSDTITPETSSDDMGTAIDTGPVLDTGLLADMGTTADASTDSSFDSSPADSAPVDTGPPDPPTGAAAVCARWKADRVSLAEGAFSGSVATCTPGTMGEPTTANTLKLINLYRWLVDLPAVTNDPARDKTAQACALMMFANGKLSHTPPTTWKCYSAEGAAAAGKSNISSGPSVGSVDAYILDRGNETTIGHRRWIMSNSLGPVGIGGTTGASCLQVIGGSGKGAKEFLAWPSGIVPIGAFAPPGSFGATLDTTGWTIQSESIKLTGGVVKVAESGVDKPVDVVALLPNYGSAQALKITPKGWKSTAGKTYQVTVTGASKPIDYKVQVVDCP